MLHDGGMGWWMVWGSVMMILFWGGIIALAVWTVQSLIRREQGTAQGPSIGPAPGAPREEPLEIARQRYAKGEISREEFEQIRNDLQRP
jgi:putative membrane protein